VPQLGIPQLDRQASMPQPACQVYKTRLTHQKSVAVSTEDASASSSSSHASAGVTGSQDLFGLAGSPCLSRFVRLPRLSGLVGFPHLCRLDRFLRLSRSDWPAPRDRPSDWQPAASATHHGGVLSRILPLRHSRLSGCSLLRTPVTIITRISTSSDFP
jgi:hypothetical protein